MGKKVRNITYGSYGGTHLPPSHGTTARSYKMPSTITQVSTWEAQRFFYDTYYKWDNIRYGGYGVCGFVFLIGRPQFYVQQQTPFQTRWLQRSRHWANNIKPRAMLRV